MKVHAAQPPLDASKIPVDELAGNKALTKDQKIAEAARQFEAILLRQILASSQKPLIQSKYNDNSTAAGIYRDMVTNQLADSISKAGTLGLAKSLDHELTRHPHDAVHSSELKKSGTPAWPATAGLNPLKNRPLQFSNHKHTNTKILSFDVP